MSRYAEKLEAAYALLNAGQLDAALAHARLIQRAAPRDADVQSLLRAIHEFRGDVEPCLFFAKAAAEAAPQRGDLQSEYGRILETQHRFDESLAFLRRGLQLRPGDESALIYLAQGLMAASHLAEAEVVLRDALKLHPNSMPLLRRMAGTLLETGRAEHAAATWEAAIALHPHDETLAMEAAANGYGLPIEPHRQLTKSQRFAGVMMDNWTAIGGGQLRARGQLGVAPFTGGRQLRVGFLSADFRNHSVGFFFLPMVQALAEMQTELTGFIYDYVGTRDSMNARIRTAAADAHWTYRDAVRTNDALLASLIARDELDVLIDLSGLSALSRPGVLAHRPAPVQATYLGFPFTTGHPDIDYRLVDDFTDPAIIGPFAGPIAHAITPGFTANPQDWYTEALVPLRDAMGGPRPFLLYGLPDELPAADSISRPPCLTSEHGLVTFGNFNMLPKMVDGCVSLMAEVLRTVPRSALALKASGLSEVAIAEATVARFAAKGIDPLRIRILPWTKGYREHFELYSTIDIALDTFPYTGTTTTIEALAMGVPVITLCPDNAPHQTRVSGSILHALGRDEWAAKTPDEYVSIAVHLATNFARIEQSRATLRQDLLSSALCDKANFAESFSRTLTDLASTWPKT